MSPQARAFFMLTASAEIVPDNNTDDRFFDLCIAQHDAFVKMTKAEQEAVCKHPDWKRPICSR